MQEQCLSESSSEMEEDFLSFIRDGINRYSEAPSLTKLTKKCADLFIRDFVHYSNVNEQLRSAHVATCVTHTVYMRHRTSRDEPDSVLWITCEEALPLLSRVFAPFHKLGKDTLPPHRSQWR